MYERHFFLSDHEPVVVGYTEDEADYDGVPGFESYVVIPQPDKED